ncbi:hypothetical protein ALP94_02707 [Pseudomonas savastanoi pv. glycinea]|nr:hypothetical protein ALP94_02707 [Pseudomonas savastanoi pv. glycinea]
MQSYVGAGLARDKASEVGRHIALSFIASKLSSHVIRFLWEPGLPAIRLAK